MPNKTGGKAQIVGFRYFMSVHMGLCRGPVNELTNIQVGGLPAWAGSHTSSEWDLINAPQLFGGDEKEGGIVGSFKICMGEPTQIPDEVIHSRMDGDPRIPGWRGVSTLFYFGQICSNNPYPKPWKFRVNRTTAGWDGDVWEPDLCQVSVSTSPVTIVAFNSNPHTGDLISIGDGVQIGFLTAAPLGFPGITIGSDNAQTAQRFATTLNQHSSEVYNVSASVNGIVVTLQFPAPTQVMQTHGTFCTIQNTAGDVKAMNPAHIVYECATNGIWGRGLPRDLIDANSFRAAAITLRNEGFGMCIRWNRTEDIDKFIANVINHIGAALYIDRRTGLLTLTLIRNDYDPFALTPYTFENGLLEITEDSSSSVDTSYNEIVVAFIDPISGNRGQIRVHNIASFQSLGSVISANVEYLGVPTASLAARLAQRDLMINSAELRRVTLKMDRAGWSINPGQVFAISVPSRGIELMICRAGNIEDGPLEDGTITIHAVQDVFSLPSASFVIPQDSFWVPTDRSAPLMDERLVGEATYYDLVGLPDTDLNAISETNGFIKVFAEQPSGLTASYLVTSKTTTETDYVVRSTAGFDAGAELSAHLDYYDTAVTFESGVLLDQVANGDPILLVGEQGEEYCRLDAWNPLLGTATIARGVIDTIPHQFAAGEKIWFQSDVPTSDFRNYTQGETVQVKLISQTNSDQLDPNLAEVDEVDIGARQGRPYPPGNFMVNSAPVFDTHIVPAGSITFDWAHRDRIVQGDFLLEHQAGSSGPEPGTTYNIRIYDGATGLSLLRSLNTNTPTWTYTSGNQTADGNLQSWWFEVESTRDGLASWQMYRFKLSRHVGFNKGFNLNFNA